MATNLEEILGKSINSVKELKDEIKRLQDSIAGANPESEQFKDTVTKLTAAQEQLSSVTRRNAADNNAAKDSIVGMEQEYRALYNTYKTLSEEQRNSDFGKEMAKNLDTLHSKLNESKMAVGNFKDNIGNYAASFGEAFKQMGISVGGLGAPLGLATNGVKAFNTALKANPVGAVIGLVITFINLLKGLKSSITSSEESQMRWNEAMSAFRPIIDAGKNAVTAFGRVIVGMVEGIANAVRWLREAGAAVTDFLGITKGANKRVKEQNEVYRDLAKSQNELTKNRREYQKLNSQDKATVESLRAEAMATQDNEEKARLLNEAKEKQQAINERNIALAEEELRQLQIEASLTDNDAAMNDKLAAAQAKVNEQRAAGAQAIRAIERAYQSANNAATGSTGKSRRQQELEEARKIQEELAEQQKTEIQLVEEKYEKEYALLKKFNMDTTLLTKKRNEDIAKIQKEQSDNERQSYMERLTQQTNFENRLRELSIQTAENLRNERAQQEAKLAEMNFVDLENSVISINGALDTYITKMGQFENEAKNILEQGLITQEKFDAGMKGQADFLQPYMDTVQQIVDETNTKLGTEIVFPPELTPENIAKFREQINMLVTIAKADLQEKIDAKIEEQVLNRVTKKTQDLMETLDAVMLENLRLSNGVEEPDWEYTEEQKKNEWERLEFRRQVMEETLSMAGLSAERRKEIELELTDVLAEMSERRLAMWEREQELVSQLWENSFSSLGTVTQSVQTLTNAIQTQIQAEIQEGKLSEAEAKKKTKNLKALEKVALAANLMGIAGSTASGIMGIWEAYGKEKIVNAETAAAAGGGGAITLASLNAKSLASAIVQTAAMATQGAANMAAATMGTISKLNSFNSASSSSSVSPIAAIQPIDSSYSFGETEQSVEGEDVINQRPLWVSVQDIRDGLRRVEVVDRESSF